MKNISLFRHLIFVCFVLLLSASVYALDKTVLLEDQANLHEDLKCGRSSSHDAWLDDCDAKFFDGFGPGGCQDSDVAEGNIGGCYFWEAEGKRVSAESIVKLFPRQASTGKLTISTSHYGGGTFKNEKVIVFVNGKKIGRTDDDWCNDSSDCHDVDLHEKVFDDVQFKKGRNEITFKAANNGGSVYVYGYKIEAEPVECEPGNEEARTCGTDVGICQVGMETRTCNNNGQWGSFEGCTAVQPEVEACNSLDDDCDGSVDDGLTCQPAGPSLNVPDQSINEDSGFNDNLVDLFQYADDSDTPDWQLVFNIVDQSNSNVVVCSLDSNRFIDCTTQEEQNGYSDITVSVSDGETTVTDVFRVNVLSVNDAPVVSFVKGSVCEDETSSFNVNAFDVDGEITSVEWDFGDGSNAVGKDVKHVYKNKGNYDLKIAVTGSTTDDIIEISEDIKVVNCDVHKIAISSAFVDDYYAFRSGDEVYVYTRVKNLGNVNEKVKLKASIEDIGISSEEIHNFDLNYREGKWNLLTFRLPDDVHKKSYVVKVVASTKTDMVVKYLTFDVV